MCGGGGKERRIVTEGTVVPESEMSFYLFNILNALVN